MNKHKHIAILLNGHFSPTAKSVTLLANSYIIAADGGITHAKQLGVTPDIWLGDFDSTDNELKDNFRDVKKVAYTTEKNMSDGELAIEHAISMNAEHITIFGGVGGSRSDHALLSVLGLVRYAARFPHIEFVSTSGRELARPLLPGHPLQLDCSQGTIFSVVALSDLQGLTIIGAKWPLSKETVAMGSTHTLSNISDGNTVIELSDGHAIALVQTND